MTAFERDLRENEARHAETRAAAVEEDDPALAKVLMQLAQVIRRSLEEGT